MEESILETIRKLIGPSASYEVFDTDLIININMAFSRLCQLGVGPENPFRIIDGTEVWSDFMDQDEMMAEVKTYVYLKVKMIFDPPSNGSVMSLYKEEIEKLEWLLKEVSRFGY